MARADRSLRVKKTKKGVSNTAGLLPEIPFRAPAGSYDVGLDAAERASGRGLADLLGDLSRDQERADVQGVWGRDDIARSRDEGLSDLDTRNTRFTRDLGTARTRGGEDYGRNKGRLGEDYNRGKGRLGEDYQSGLANLARSYQRQGSQQREGFLSAGGRAGGGGALKQAARKRADNQAWDRKPMDTNFQRGNEDMDRGFQRGNQDLDTGYNRQQQDWTTNEQDWGQDYGTQRGRITSGADRDLGRLTVAGSWDAQDRITGGTRAQRENQYFGQDTQAARIQQVQQTNPGALSDWQKRNKQRGFRQF